MEAIFLILGSIFFGLHILDNLLDKYFMWRAYQHDRYCEDCYEQEIINEIRKK